MSTNLSLQWHPQVERAHHAAHHLGSVLYENTSVIGFDPWLFHAGCFLFLLEGDMYLSGQCDEGSCLLTLSGEDTAAH